MNWREKIEAQIAELRRNGVAMHFHAADTLQALLDVAVAANWFAIHTPAKHIPGLVQRGRYEQLEDALDKLREVE